ncbi:hypothetical protein EGH22_00220 [Halomicroarcula sp. F28]|uniref:hypothetical protein n=1 Tax=Haloarcula salinisoli TaxID=2487746 RepID=UPI001C7370B0|nr:hypothetical protein [Halomicroarcula salinisoli]MBX0284741.1 hypothetical protein [Halomicroarcula salinisoli]
MSDDTLTEELTEHVTIWPLTSDKEKWQATFSCKGHRYGGEACESREEALASLSESIYEKLQSYE